jgi:hypothetical protein
MVPVARTSQQGADPSRHFEPPTTCYPPELLRTDLPGIGPGMGSSGAWSAQRPPRASVCSGGQHTASARAEIRNHRRPRQALRVG